MDRKRRFKSYLPTILGAIIVLFAFECFISIRDGEYYWLGYASGFYITLTLTVLIIWWFTTQRIKEEDASPETAYKPRTVEKPNPYMQKCLAIAVAVPIAVVVTNWRTADSGDMEVYKERLAAYALNPAASPRAHDVLGLEGKRICMAYTHYKNKMYARPLLKKWFPDKAEEMEKLVLYRNQPSLLIAIDTPDGLRILSGSRLMRAGKRRVLVLANADGKALPDDGEGCIPYEKAFFKAERQHVTFKSGSANSVNYILLMEK